MNSRTCRPPPRWCWPRAARCCPTQKILETTQDRLAEKDFVKRLGIGTADYADVSSVRSAARRDRAHRPAGRAQDPPLRL